MDKHSIWGVNLLPTTRQTLLWTSDVVKYHPKLSTEGFFFTAFSATCSRGGEKNSEPAAHLQLVPCEAVKVPGSSPPGRIPVYYRSLNTDPSSWHQVPTTEGAQPLLHFKLSFDFFFLFLFLWIVAPQEKKRKKRPPAGPTFTPCVNIIIYFWLRLLVGASCPAAGTQPWKPASSWADRDAWGMEGAGTIRWTLSAGAAGIRCYARLATGQPGRRAIDCAEILSTVIKELWDASSVS